MPERDDIRVDKPVPGGQPPEDRAALAAIVEPQRAGTLTQKLKVKLMQVLEDGCVEERQEFDGAGNLKAIVRTRTSGVEAASRLAALIANMFPTGLDDMEADIKVVIHYDGPDGPVPEEHQPPTNRLAPERP